MATGYEEAYAHLEEASNSIPHILEETGNARKAALRVFFYHLSQSANLSLRCIESSTKDAMGGSYEFAKQSAHDYTEAVKRSDILAASTNEELESICNNWISRTKTMITKIRRDEAKMTNIQYARIPEEQDFSILTKDGKSFHPQYGNY